MNNYKVKTFLKYVCLVMPHCREENFAIHFWNYHNLDNNKAKKNF